jgi:hypothetical protein
MTQAPCVNPSGTQILLSKELLMRGIMPKLALSCTNSSHKKGLLKSRQQMPDSPSLTSAKKGEP